MTSGCGSCSGECVRRKRRPGARSRRRGRLQPDEPRVSRIPRRRRRMVPRATLRQLSRYAALVRRGRAKMDGAPRGLGLATIERYADTWKVLHARIAHRFARCEARERAGRYLAGLLERVERNNGWQLAEAMGEAGPHGVQRLLNAATWDTDGVRDDLRNYVVNHLGDKAAGVLIVDETGFLKKGSKSCGVARQYSSKTGTTENCQVGVFLAYAAQEGAAFIDRALYLLREWTDDRARRTEAGVPEDTRFATKIELAQRMLGRAFDADARALGRCRCPLRSHELWRWLEARERPCTLMIPKTNAVHQCGPVSGPTRTGRAAGRAAGPGPSARAV